MLLSSKLSNLSPAFGIISDDSHNTRRYTRKRKSIRAFVNPAHEKKKNGTEEWSGRSTTETDVTSFKRHKISADNYAKRVAFLEAKFRGEAYPDQNNAIDTGYRNLSSAAIPLSIRSTSRITRTKLHNLGIILETPE